MKPVSALLVGVGDVSKLAHSLHTILEPSFRVDLQMHPKLMGACEVADISVGIDNAIRRFNPALIFLVASPNLLKETREILLSLRRAALDIPIAVAIDASEPDQVFELLKAGAADFMVPPLKPSEVLPRAWRLLEQPDQLQKLTRAVKTGLGLKKLIGQSPAFLTQVEKIPLIAKCEANVLIAGETGTGKELYARAIHYCGGRTGKPFVPVNCGAIPVDLVENELFGHQRGAFTGAVTLQTGLVEEASGGTLFLDEVDCLPALAQVKLLRFLQEKEYRPLGSATTRRADVRVIAASNLNLEDAVAHGKLRQDLYYRLNIISLTLPPLRERREDIPLLACHFASKYATEVGKESAEFSPDAMHSLMTYDWPGNVRELEHEIERAVVMYHGPIIRGSDLELRSTQADVRQESLKQAKAREIARFEKNYVQSLLSSCGGNITRAAQVAQKNRRAFWQLIQKHQIEVARFKSTVK